MITICVRVYIRNEMKQDLNKKWGSETIFSERSDGICMANLIFAETQVHFTLKTTVYDPAGYASLPVLDQESYHACFSKKFDTGSGFFRYSLLELLLKAL